MEKIHKIIIGVLACVLTIGVGGEVLYHFNGDVRNFINQLFHIKDSKNLIDYDSDNYVLSLVSDKESLEAIIARYESEDDVLNKRIKELQKRVATLESQVAELQQKEANLNEQVAQLSDEVDELWDLLFDYLENRSTENIDSVVESKVVVLENKLASLTSQYQQVSAENNSKIQELNQQINNLNNEKTNTQNQMATNQTTINNNTININNLGTNRNTYYSRLISLENKVERGTATDEEKTEIVELKNTIKTIDDSIETLRNENLELSERAIAYQLQLDDLETRIAVLEQQVAQLTEEMTAIQNAINQTQSDIDRFRNYLEENPNIHTHSPSEAVVENNVPATCTQNGSYDKVVYCEDDDFEISRTTYIVLAHGHASAEITKENIIDATCTTAGSYEAVKYCDECGTELSRETVVVPAKNHAHTHIANENTVDSTCIEFGHYDKVVYCDDCDEELSRETLIIAKKQHTSGSPANENFVDSTCTQTGHYDNVIYCEDCESELSRETIEISLKNHIPNDYVIENNVDATSEHNGHYDKVVYCENCESELSRETIEVEYINPNDYTDSETGTVIINYQNFESEQQEVALSLIAEPNEYCGITKSIEDVSYTLYYSQDEDLKGLWIYDNDNDILYYANDILNFAEDYDYFVLDEINGDVYKFSTMSYKYTFDFSNGGLSVRQTENYDMVFDNMFNDTQLTIVDYFLLSEEEQSIAQEFIFGGLEEQYFFYYNIDLDLDYRIYFNEETRPGLWIYDVNTSKLYSATTLFGIENNDDYFTLVSDPTPSDPFIIFENSSNIFVINADTLECEVEEKSMLDTLRVYNPFLEECVDIINYNLMTDEQKLIAETVVSECFDMDMVYECDGKFYIHFNDYEQVIGLWILDTETKTFSLANFDYNYDEFSIVTSSYVDNNLLYIITPNSKITCNLLTNESTIEAYSNILFYEYNDYFVYNYNSFSADNKNAVKDLIDNIDKVQTISIDNGWTLVYGGETSQIKGVWAMQNNTLFMLGRRERNELYVFTTYISGSEYNFQSENYICKVNAYGTNINASYTYTYKNVEIVNYKSFENIKYNNVPMANYIIDNPNDITYLDCGSTKLIYRVGTANAGLWWYHGNTLSCFNDPNNFEFTLVNEDEDNYYLESSIIRLKIFKNSGGMVSY